jgi:hypothetical protein
MSNGIALAAVSGIFKKTDVWIITHVTADDVCGVVARTIIDHDDLGVPPLLGDVDENLVECLNDALTLVVRRYDDAVRRNSAGG